ncbi:MAG: L-threonylcarbamoyladenylate synthase [Clostridia bacterium]|nr:L-threonylcarbamoyladenylate synthase [Clostridia bacterium]
MEEKDTKYLSTSDCDLQLAAELLKQGGTVIFPTETVYGLGANALDSNAAEKIFAAKGRPSDNPLIVHIAARDALTPLVAEIPEVAERLMDAFWPGPLTLIFKKSNLVPKAVTGGLETVAVRMPNQPVAKRLLELAQIPVAAPSANLSGKPSPTTFAHAKADMAGRVDAIIDGENCQVGVESTVLDISGEIPILYRPGGVTVEQIETMIGPIQVITKTKEGETPKSPGLKYKHYAPEADLQILHGSMEQVQAYVKDIGKTYKTAVLVFDEFPEFSEGIITYSLGSQTKPEEAANRLFSALRELDLQGVQYIFAPELPANGVWRAVRNRMYRAAGETIIDLTKVKKQILFLCTGNTCRSPMAEGILKHMAEEEGLPVSVSSAGLYADGSPASQYAVAVMKELGIDISKHCSRQFTAELAENADLILTMTSAHKQMADMLLPQYQDKSISLAQWAGEEGDIHDPFGGDITEYRHCRDEIRQMIETGRRKHL